MLYYPTLHLLQTAQTLVGGSVAPDFGRVTIPLLVSRSPPIRQTLVALGLLTILL